ncbi:hypothetical protein H0H81_004270 [Sphagnurus paluster]|uniref:Vacuolar sorting protein Vps3844 C-terminal domain-containing protein n=1 Tax=Sphagnurus paluster TaxID=117069 RepID=A0A9P7FUX6_9AGAR|nr:hypothetical protein H0H81_004270 [Sphagnurus paluster]
MKKLLSEEDLSMFSFSQWKSKMQKVGSCTYRLQRCTNLDAVVLSSSIQPSFKLSTSPETPVESLSSVLSTYLHRAPHSFASIYQDGLSHQLEDLESVTTFFKSAETPAFAALEVAKLADLRRSFGPSSYEYAVAADEIRHFLEQTYENADTLHIALLTFAPSSPTLEKRRPQASQSPLPPNHPPPQEPIGSISTCFTTLDTCTNSTNSCSGRGQCLEATKSGRTCFVCACGVTKTGEGSKLKTDIWVGQSCERKDISA